MADKTEPPAPTDPKAADITKTDPTAGVATGTGDAAKPPPAPDYFSGSNPDNPELSVEDKKDEAKVEQFIKNKEWPDAIGANSGAWATPAGDGKGDTTADITDPKKSPQYLYDRIAHNLFSINIVWTLVTGFLVMFMQAGFMYVETGLCRAKNAGHTAAMNFMIYPLGCIAFWAYGFAIGWGNWYSGAVPNGWYPSLGPGLAALNSGEGIGPNMKIKKDADGNNVKDKDGKDVLEKDKDGKDIPDGTYKWGLFGTKGFFLQGVDDTGVMALFFFMMVFMDTTATIPTGAMAERWAWKNFCLYGLWIALPYCIYANWVWGGGWLAQMGVNWKLGHGAVDFAGSGVVHGMGGIIGLIGSIVLGPRIGKYVDGKIHPIPAHDIPMVVLGTFILAFGWFGFNPGSTLAGTDLRISMVVVNTMLASVTGALAAHATLSLMGLKPDPSMLCNGMLAGLVAITAPCAFVDSVGAGIIGGVAGVLVVFSVFFFDKMKVDDCVGAISVHGVNGLWGVLSVGLFANGKYGAGWNGVERFAGSAASGFTATDATKLDWMNKHHINYDGVRGLFYGDASQLAAQAIDCVVLFVFAAAMAFIWFKISNLITPIRVTAEVEMAGLDVHEMGAEGYPDFAKVSH